MRDPDEFDAFYKDARERLLLQTYAITGDLAASRSAVRDSFVVCWHHWRKVSRLEDPEGWARPRAWAHAQRRHTARLGHRDKGLDPEVQATLDALAKLSTIQRKTLVLTQLAAVSRDEMAREVGLPLDDAERELQTATAQFSIHRDVLAAEIRLLFADLPSAVRDVRWPRPTILRRAGAARRRTHTAIGAFATVAVLVLAGSLVTDTDGVRPRLDRDLVSTFEGHGRVPEPAPEVALPEEALLSAAQLDRLVAGRDWAVTATSDNTGGSGLTLPCQRMRYADPRGTAALVRTFGTSPGRPRDPEISAVQAAEVSAGPKAAHRTYATTLGWYAGCTDERVQLLSTRRIEGVGDRAMLLVLRDWDLPVTTMVVGVAATGQLTTTTMTRVTNTSTPDFKASAELLAAAVNGLCGLPNGGACSLTPQLEVVRPLPLGAAPAMLGEIDLPPVTTINRPWVGTEPRKALMNVASTRCDEADFNRPFEGRAFSNNLTRSFLIPGADLPAEFGLTETVGSLPRKQARAFVEEVRNRLAACPDQDLGTEVERVAHVDSDRLDLTVWQVTTEISDNSSVRYLMAIARTGTSIAQIGFVPSGPVDMPGGAFIDLANRALDRLAKLPPPHRG